MSQFSSQINLVKKIKGLVKKAKHSLQLKKQSGTISEKIALQIQKNAYDISRRQIKDTYTPVYKNIAEQLQATDDQIFRSAVYNLTKMAQNKHFTEEIIALLQKQQKNPDRTSEQQEYLEQKIAKIKR